MIPDVSPVADHGRLRQLTLVIDGDVRIFFTPPSAARRTRGGSRGAMTLSGRIFAAPNAPAFTLNAPGGQA